VTKQSKTDAGASCGLVCWSSGEQERGGRVPPRWCCARRAAAPALASSKQGAVPGGTEGGQQDPPRVLRLRILPETQLSALPCSPSPPAVASRPRVLARGVTAPGAGPWCHSPGCWPVAQSVLKRPSSAGESLAAAAMVCWLCCWFWWPWAAVGACQRCAGGRKVTSSYLNSQQKSPSLLRFVFMFRYSKSDAFHFCLKPLGGRNLILNEF